MKGYYLFLFTLLLSIGIAKGQTETPIQSIFDYDTCAPPCWMGLIPGESSAADVDAMLAKHQDLINPDDVTLTIARAENGDFMLDDESGEIIRATYNFTILEPFHDLMRVTSRISIRDRVVYKMIVHAHQRITLLEVLENLGEPDIVRLDMGGTERAWLILIYQDLQLQLNLIQEIHSCNTLDLNSEMTVRGTNYFSDEASMELASFSTDVLQPALTAYRLPEERDVPPDIWQSWLEGEVDMSCEEAWEGLPEPEITPVAETPIQSIFDYDTCAPPCWMGLIPGESTAADVDAMLAQHQDLIDPDDVTLTIARAENGDFMFDDDTDELILGGYSLTIGEPYHDMMGLASRIEIRDRVVYEMIIHAHQRITLLEVLENLGEPDIVRLDMGGTERAWLILIYLDLQLRISLIQPGESCNTLDLEDEMTVRGVIYLSDEASMELVSFSTDVLQPLLTAYRLPEERDVPPDIWQSWLEGEVNMSCEEAWEGLPEPEATELPIPTEESR